MLQSVLTVGQQVLILFILSGVGFILGKAKMIGDNFSREASQFIMYVVSPCMMVVAFQRRFEENGFHNFCMALLLGILIHVVGIVLAELLIREKSEKGQALRFSVVHSNCGFMGYPLQTALLGTIGVFYGSAFVTAFTLCSWTYGLVQMSGGKQKISLKTLLLNPGIISVVIALALYLSRVTLPDLILSPVTYLSQLNTPLPMAIVGYQLSQANILSALRGLNTWLAIFLRLIVTPLIAMGLCMVFHAEHAVSVAVVSAAAAPCAALLSIFAARFERDTALASGLVAAETLLSALTMPIMVGLAVAFL